ncbi:MAG: hypothetical protein CMI94_00265 [Pelagibacteraceae bacterium]|nr:hypothetical protein [Pelagibacteraceae bacterium]
MGKFLKIVIVFVLVDIIFSAIIFSRHFFRDTDYFSIADQFHFTRYFVSPFLEGEQKKLPDNIEFLGFHKKLSKKKIYISDPVLGWRLGKNRADLKTPFSYNKPALRITNSQGFGSSGEFQYFYKKKKPDDIYRVVILGGSTVFGDGAESIKDNLPSKLKNEFIENQDIKQKIEIINAGVGGYDSGQEFMYLYTELLSFKPDLVLVYNGWNDQLNAVQKISKLGSEVYNNQDWIDYYYKPSHLNIKKISNQSFTFFGSTKIFLNSSIVSLRRFFEGSSTFYLFKKFYTFFGKKETKENFLPNDVIDFDSYISKYYKKNIETMIQLSNSNNFKIAILLQPILGVSDELENQYGHLELDSKVISYREDFYNKVRITLNNLNDKYKNNENICIKDISQNIFKNITSRVYEDSGHLLGKGNEIVAKKVYAHLSSCFNYN